MKRFWLVLLAVALLCGCTAAPNTPTEPAAEPVLSEAPWDLGGVLTELILDIPGGNSYTNCLGFRDCILLWTTDGHLVEEQVLEFCLIDPAAKTIVASREVTMPNPVEPQIYGNALYLCDPITGTVVELDRNLEITGQWQVPASNDEGAVWYAANRKLWEFSYGKTLRCLSLGDVYWSEEAAYWTEVRRPQVEVIHHRRNGGIVTFISRNGETEKVYALDLTEGTVITPPQGYESYERSGNVWLGAKIGWNYGICVANGAMRKISPTDGRLTLLQEGYLLEKSPNDQYLRLYDREGRCISVCQLWETMDGQAERLIWNDRLGGYLIHYRPHSGGTRLLFWDIQKGSDIGQDLKLRSIPDAENLQDALRAEAAEIGQRFGVTIRVGTDCDLETAAGFGDGASTYAVDFDQVCNGLDVLEKALTAYPEGSFRGLRIQLFADLSGAVSIVDEFVDVYFDVATLDEALVHHVLEPLTGGDQAAE